MSENETLITACSHDCGGRCVLKLHVHNDRIVKIETDDGDEPQLRACLRGRAYRQRVYSPDRLKYPMKRVGERGEGKFERISWDEALDTVASELIRIRDTHGNASILYVPGAGSQSVLHGAQAVERLLAKFGGYTRFWGTPSFEGALFGSMASYGTIMTGNDRADLLNSKIIIMWGWNPAVTVWDSGTMLALIKAKEQGIKIICVDPRLTESTAVLGSEWIPIRPSTDAAMLIAMAYVMLEHGLYDQSFLDTYTIGFEKFRDYVLGSEDGISKTPIWAEKITGVPSSTIERIAMEYATAKPAALIPGWGPARMSMGEQFSRAAIVLCCMTGNVGKEGGYSGGFMRAFHSRQIGMPRGERNPVEVGSAYRPNSLYKMRGAGHPTAARIHMIKLHDAILQGKAGGYPCDPKMAYIVASSYPNSYPNINKAVTALKSLEFVVVQEQRMTPGARFADILLPVNTFMEREDVISPWLGSPYLIHMEKAIESMYESKTDRDICDELAKRLSIADYREGYTDEEWLRFIAETTGDVTDYAEFKKRGVLKLKSERPFVAFREQIEDPGNNPFPTFSGKIEIYSEHIAEMQNPKLPPVPKYITAVEGYGDPLSKQFPLQLTTTHHKPATHSSLEGVPWLTEVEPRELWINPKDAEIRDVSHGDEVLVFNNRGKVLVKAKVTERIMPGVVNLGQGGWFDIGEDGIDRGVCANMLVPDEHSPGGAWSCNTVLVEVIRA
jgi:anaerobic dimethyl sulfoxide reductase subunit A